MNTELIRTALLGFAILSIVSQVPCTDYVVKLGSNLSDKTWKWGRFKNLPSAKRIHAAINSLIVANAIMFTVLLKMHWVAAGWCVIEIYIAWMYVWAANDRKLKNGNFKNPDLPEKVAGYSMAVLNPISIYSFTFMYVEYQWIIEQFNK